MTDPDFLDDEQPQDGSRSVTSLGRLSGPIHREPVEPSHGSSLATPNLGIHVMDNTAVDDDTTP